MRPDMEALQALARLDLGERQEAFAQDLADLLRFVEGVKGVNAIFGYKEMPIYSPAMLVGGADNDP